jgi:hypothetical protein
MSNHRTLISSFSKLKSFIKEVRSLPEVSIQLMHERSVDNDPFFGKIVKDFFNEANARHKKFPLIRQLEYGLAVCELPQGPGAYFNKIESSARRNHKKAVREGCSFRRINFNDHIDDIRDIWMSTDTRQGKLMPKAMREGEVNRISDPPSKSNLHDYPYFGVFYQEKLVGYMGCLIAGEFAGIQQIYGHSNHLALGIVPQLFIGFAEELPKSYPQVKYMAYGSYFGAGETMQRFKRKFLMHPHKVRWIL